MKASAAQLSVAQGIRMHRPLYLSFLSIRTGDYRCHVTPCDKRTNVSHWLPSSLHFSPRMGGHRGRGCSRSRGSGGVSNTPVWGTWGPMRGGDKEGSEDMGITAFFKITHLGSVHLLLFHHIIYFLLGENFSHYHNSTLKMYFSLILL